MPGNLHLELTLNGETMQDATTSDLLFDLPALIAGASQNMPLLPGDLLLTGSPAGNGIVHGRMLRDGDVMVGAIEGLGAQTVRCIAEDATMTRPTEHPAELDRTDPDRHVVESAEAFRNWGRWGDDDRLGTLNFIGEGERARAASLVRRGVSFSLSQPFDMDGPQQGWRRRTNPVHTMLDTGTDAAAGLQGFPHGLGGADDVIAMPLQCSTQWDGLGHIFDRGVAWNGRPAGSVVTSSGDLVTGIEHAASVITGRGVLLDLGRFLRPEASGDGAAGELPDGYAITSAELDACIAAQGATSAVGRGDLVLVRTGRYSRARREGWNGYAGGPSAGLSFTTAGWLHRTEIAAIATDTWGFEVRPNEFDEAFQPLHQVAIPNIGLTIGEMWDLDGLAADCAGRRRLRVPARRAAPPDHGGRRFAGQPHRPEVSPNPTKGSPRCLQSPVSPSPAPASPAPPPPSCSPKEASRSTSSR